MSSSCTTTVYDDSAVKARFKAMEERIKKEPATLFLVIQDEAHHSATFNGAANEFMNHPTVRTSPNVVILRVSATPYNLQTALAQTPLENEIHWGDRGSYYGINECTVTEALLGASPSMRAVLQAMSVLCNPVVVDSTVHTIKQTLTTAAPPRCCARAGSPIQQRCPSRGDVVTPRTCCLAVHKALPHPTAAMPSLLLPPTPAPH